MSKSYDNTIPLFAPREQLRKLIMGILTDSRAPGEPKDTAGSALFQLYQAFASADETAELAQAYAAGIAWGEAKERLFERLDREITPLRGIYDELMRDPARIEGILRNGAEKARAVATPFTAQLRHAVGLRPLVSAPSTAQAARGGKAAKVAAPSFKQYRESDGLFYFKLLDTKGLTLLQSKGFSAPKDAAQTISRLQREGAAALTALADVLTVQADQTSLEAALQHFQDPAAP